MDAGEVGKILGLMATYDHRKIAETDIAAWSLIIGKLPYADAKDAVLAHYAQTDQRMMPSHVVQFVKRRQDDQRARVEPGKSMAQTMEDDIPDADPDDVGAYLAALREGRMRSYDDGTARPRPLRALLSRVFPIPPGGSDDSSRSS